MLCYCHVAMGLRFFQICHCVEFNKIVEATVPVNPYDDRKFSLRRPHENGDLDIILTLYTRLKANVTEALWIFLFENRQIKKNLRNTINVSFE